MSTSQCLHIEQHNVCNTLDWGNAYKYDNNKFRIISHLRKHKADNWSPAGLKDVNIKYHIFLKRGQLQMLNNCLIFYKPVMMNIQYLALFVVPQNLRKRLFNHYHSGPTGRHMGEYKTLYRMRYRFYWPKTHDDFKPWLQSCAHYTTYYIWRNLKRKLYLYWTITTQL